MSDKPPAQIDSQAVLHFWEQRAKSYEGQDLVNLSNLEADAELAKYKHERELDVLSQYMRPSAKLKMLDLGAGHGAWSAVFAPQVHSVTAVEYASGMAAAARDNVERKGIENVQVVCAAAQDFESEEKYDLVLLSGLTIYLNEDELDRLLLNLSGYTASNARVILRDGTGKTETFTINNRFSDELQANYSAFYRTAEQYIKKFAEFGFAIRQHQNMFPDGSVLNKRVETILRVYEFEKGN